MHLLYSSCSKNSNSGGGEINNVGELLLLRSNSRLKELSSVVGNGNVGVTGVRVKMLLLCSLFSGSISTEVQTIVN